MIKNIIEKIKKINYNKQIKSCKYLLMAGVASEESNGQGILDMSDDEIKELVINVSKKSKRMAEIFSNYPAVVGDAIIRRY